MRTNLWIVSGLVLAGAVMTAYCLPLPGKETRYTLVKDEEAGEDKVCSFILSLVQEIHVYFALYTHYHGTPARCSQWFLCIIY